MSLINDALNRARAEASGREAAERGEIPAVEGPRAPAVRRRPAWTLVSVGVAIVVVLGLLARRGPSTTEPLFERTAQVPAAEPAQPAEPQPPAPAAVERSTPVQEPAPSADVLAANDRPSPRAPARTQPATEPEPEAAAPELAQTSGTSHERAPTSTSAEPQTSDPLPSEPLAEIRVDATRAAATETERPSPSEPAVRPTTIWPTDGPDQETWYFVGKVELAGGGEIELGGIAWSELAPSAMLNGSLLAVGSEILGLRIVAITPRTVTFAGQGQRIALQLGSAAN